LHYDKSFFPFISHCFLRLDFRIKVQSHTWAHPTGVRDGQFLQPQHHPHGWHDWTVSLHLPLLSCLESSSSSHSSICGTAAVPALSIPKLINYYMAQRLGC
jgi:hypothetical protein